MKNVSTKESFFIGFSLSNSATYDSSICILDRNFNIVFLEKFYSAQDIDFFFENSSYINSSLLCAGVPYDNKMLDGKWRIHSKNYKVLSDYFKINKDDWTNRISKRCLDTLSNLNKKIKIIRADINQLRMSYGLNSYYLSRTSIDCKNLQNSLKIKFNLLELPDNMLPASSLEAIIYAIFAFEYASGKVETSTLFEIDSIPVLARALEN